MLKKGAREPYKEIGVAQCFQGLRRFCFQTREAQHRLSHVFQSIMHNFHPLFIEFPRLL